VQKLVDISHLFNLINNIKTRMMIRTETVKGSWGHGVEQPPICCRL